MSDVQTLTQIDYPESDGQPMGETDVHRAWMVRLYDLLSYRYRGERVYVGSDLLLYFEEGNPRKFVVPDVFVAIGSDPSPRRTFKAWEESRAPDVVFEVTSRSTRREDEVFKPKQYGLIGVQELFLYDPTGDYLSPPLRGFRFEDGEPTQIAFDDSGSLECRSLGISLRLEEDRLLVIDTATGEPLLTEAEAERRAREAAEAEVRKLREELTRRRADDDD